MLASRATLLALLIVPMAACRPATAGARKDDELGICSPSEESVADAGPAVPGAVLLESADGRRLRASIVLPRGEAKGLVLLLPGAWFPRDDSFVELSAKLADRGLASARFEQRCHLRSLASDTFLDIDAVLIAARKKVGARPPLFALGHSRGAWYIMKGAVGEKLAPARTVFIAGGHEDKGHYDEVAQNAEKPVDALKAKLRDAHAASRPELEKELARAEAFRASTMAFLQKLKAGALKDDETIPGDKSLLPGLPIETAAQFRSENDLHDFDARRAFIAKAIPTLLLIGDGDRPHLKKAMERLAGMFPAGAPMQSRVLPGFDHTLNGPSGHVPDGLARAVADWFLGTTAP
ncbi:MAG: alpha/beta hydrolase [Elusimicrobiota bacterium]